jgi:hypothetical protein
MAVRPYPLEKRIRLAVTVARLGDIPVAEQSDVCSATILRVVAGRGVTPAVAAALDRAVDALASSHTHSPSDRSAA